MADAVAHPAVDGTEVEIRRRIIRVAAAIGFASVAAVVSATALPHLHHQRMQYAAAYGLAALGAVANVVFAVLGLRWADRRTGDALLLVWALGLVVWVAALVYVGGGAMADYHLLFFPVLVFVAATQPARLQVLLVGLALVVYVAVVWAVPVWRYPGNVLLRLGSLAATAALAGHLAGIVREEIGRRARLQMEAELERATTVEAHHRIKNELQLVAELLSLEAAKPGAELADVVTETVGRIQSVAAAHSSLALRNEGQVGLRPVLERVTSLLVDRLAAPGSAEAELHGDCTVSSRRAVWAALAVSELVTNALRHGGGGRVRVELNEGAACRIAVRDEGPGMAGTVDGLGLTLVRRLAVEGLGGTVEVDSSSKGTSVTLTFPSAMEADG
jgi:two-component sensor histidine kinase